MSVVLGRIISVVIGVSSGVVIATAILAFIVAIGIIPRLAEKTNTRTHVYAIGTAGVLGASIGSVFSLFDLTLHIPKVCVGTLALFMGIYIGCLAVALAEVLNVMPIAKMRLQFTKGMRLILLVFSIGKLIGSLIYWFHPGFIF